MNIPKIIGGLVWLACLIYLVVYQIHSPIFQEGLKFIDTALAVFVIAVLLVSASVILTVKQHINNLGKKSNS